MVSHKIIRCPRHGNAMLQQPHFQLAKVLFLAAIRKRNQCLHRNTALNGFHQRPFDLAAVIAEDQDLDALLSTLQRREDRLNTVVRLNHQLQSVVLLLGAACTREDAESRCEDVFAAAASRVRQNASNVSIA